MSQWFAPLDQAIGGIADALKGTGETIGETAGGLFGGLFGGIGNWLFQLAFVALAAWVAIEVFA